MADDVVFTPVVATPPTGTVVATDEVDGRQVQLMGIIPGPADTAIEERIGGDAEFGMDVDVTRLPNAGTANNALVLASRTAVTLQAANPARLGWSITNSAPAELLLKLGLGASLTSLTVPVPPGGYFEVPFRYTGIITGLWPDLSLADLPSTLLNVSLNPQGDVEVDERWNVTTTSPPLTLGDFKITFGADTTPALSWDITTPDLIAALEALSSVGPGNIQEDPNDLGHVLSVDGYVALQWINALGAADQPPATITDDTTDGGVVIEETETGAPNTLTPTGGTFTLLVSIDAGPVVETAPIAWDADNLDIRIAIADALGVDYLHIDTSDGPLPFQLGLFFTDGPTVSQKLVTVEVGDVSLDDASDPPVIISDYVAGGAGVAHTTEFS